MMPLTCGHDGQLGHAGHEHWVEVGDGAGGDDGPSNGLGQAESVRESPPGNLVFTSWLPNTGQEGDTC